MLSGGSAKCLTLRLNEPLDAPNHAPDPSLEMHSRQMELTGHIIDSGILTRVMDLVPSMGGMFKVLRFDPGVRKEDSSSMVMEVTAPGEGLLEEVLLQLLSLGGRLLEPEAVPARLERVQKKGVAPRSFYSTTIFRTEILYQGRWLTAQKQRMDAAIVVEDHQDGPVVVCRLLRDLKVGDRVVVGSEGLRLHTRRTQQKDGDDFKFMGSGVSSERRVEAAVDMIAWEMRQIRSRGGRIVVVPGPVVVHTGGAPHLAALVRDGYVQALLGGNAIAVHDLESCLYGTSLGVDLQRGLPVTNGHRHHINTINIIREFGGIREAVDAGVITQGLFYEVIKSGIPFCLAGSIRDDGPLPETQMDLVIAQREYARLLEGAEMVLMLSSMLHSIGVGNMTPAGVRMVCVDINPAVATKLADRGSLDATPIVTDVGLFLNMLVRKIAELEDK
jgi:lysine-ketoglutarate reductase/saccharopine dehydrogenase-like protein (TIGR00300 family)